MQRETLKKSEQGSSQWGTMRGQEVQEETQEVPAEYQEMLFCCDGD